MPAVRQCRAFGGGQAAPDTVLADIPVPQRQRQALGADQAGGAHVIAAAASRRALPISTLTGNHWSGSRLLPAQRACLITRIHNARSVHGMTTSGYGSPPLARSTAAVGP